MPLTAGERVYCMDGVIHMQIEYRTLTTILPGHRIEVAAPHLREGDTVEVLIVRPEVSNTRFASALDFLRSLPPGPRAFKTWDEYEKHLQDERNAWDR